MRKRPPFFSGQNSNHTTTNTLFTIVVFPKAHLREVLMHRMEVTFGLVQAAAKIEKIADEAAEADTAETGT